MSLFKNSYVGAHLLRKLEGKIQKGWFTTFDVEQEGREGIERAVPAAREGLTMEQWQSHTDQQIPPEDLYQDSGSGWENGTPSGKSSWGCTLSPKVTHTKRGKGPERTQKHR